MRLIDADALMELIKDHEKNLVYNITHSKTKGITKSRDFIMGVEDGYYRVFSDLKQMPTIEAEPISRIDLQELEDRFGKYVRFVVEDMMSGEGKRWKNDSK